MSEGQVTFKESGCGGERCRRCRKWWRSNLLVILLFLSVVAGAGAGYLLRSVPPFDKPKLNTRAMMLLFFPAELMIRLLTLISLPLIVSSMVSAIGAMDASTGGKIGLRTVGYYVGTTMLAVCEGLGFIYAVRPGAGDATLQKLSVDPTLRTTKVEAILDMIRNVFPDNIIRSTISMHYTDVSFTEVELNNETKQEFLKLENVSGFNAENLTFYAEQFDTSSKPVMNILGITFFSIMFGMAVSSLGNKGKILVEVVDEIFVAMMKIIKVILWIYPLGVFFMIAHTVIGIEDPVEYLTQMMYFLVTVLGALLTHALIVLPLIYLVFARKNPFRLFANCFKAILTAFATSNSNATMPVTMKCLEDSGVHSHIIRFMIPIGATVNMDGFALYEAMAAIFIATLRGMNPGPGEIAALGFTSVAISIGAPTVGHSVVLLTILFNTLGLPVQDIALLIPLDWFLGRLRTVTNVWGDCVGTGVVARWSRSDLERISQLYEEGDSDLLEHPRTHEDAVLTRYAFRDGHKDWTVRLINETGDRLLVSKV